MIQSNPPSQNVEGEAFPPVEDILPHRGTMRLIDAVLACNDESLTAQAHVESDAWYANADGAMPAWIGIELMAQAIAAHVGLLEMRAGNKMRPGVLLGSHRYEAHIPAFARDALLRIEVKELLRGDARGDRFGFAASGTAVNGHRKAVAGQLIGDRAANSTACAGNENTPAHDLKPSSIND